MAYCLDAFNRLVRGNIARTPSMRGYVRRIVLAYRTEVPEGTTGDNVASGHAYFCGWDPETGSGIPATADGVAAPSLADVRASLTVDPADRDYPAGTDKEADVRFRFEFVENPEWANADSDNKAVYAIDCWQWGGTIRTGSFDKRIYRVTTRSTPSSAEAPAGDESAPDPGEIDFTVAWLLDNATVGASSGLYGTYTVDRSGATPVATRAASDLVLDNETLGILMSPDWASDETEDEYVSSMTSHSRW